MMTPTKIGLVLVLVTSGKWSQASAVAFFNPDVTTPIPEDQYPDCSTWADLGECNLYYEYMFEHSTASSVTGEDLGTVGYFLEQDGGEIHDGEIDECINLQDFKPNISSTCEELAHVSLCHLNPAYMANNCARSCLLCIPIG